MKAVLMLSNCDSREEAEHISTELLRQKLAAAVQIIGPTDSRYRWRDEIHSKQEWLMVIKTCDTCAEKIKSVLTELHSYELPGILKINIDGGENSYLNWIVGNSILSD